MHIGNYLPERGLRGDLHAVVSGRFNDGSAAIRIYVCEFSGDGTAGNLAAWAPFQRTASHKQEA
jgi:hypothetical protein